MANVVLLIGEPGSGKSTSICSLDPNETFIISVIDKPLPFRGYKKNYRHITDWSDSDNNRLCSHNHQAICKAIEIANNRPDIKNLIVDDWQYILVNEFMARAMEKGFDKFSQMSCNAFSVIRMLMQARDDLFCVLTAHTDTDSYGKIKTKTIGKMLDEKVSIEGMFTVVLHALVSDEGHRFLTQNDGIHLAKSPLEMFEDKYIPNDLQMVRNKIFEYYEGE